MSRHLPLLAATIVCLGLVVLHLAVISPCLIEESTPADRPSPRKAPKLEVEPEDKPDFAAIQPISKRKQAFFAFMDEFITTRNQEILALRKRIDKNSLSADEWRTLALRYRVRSTDPSEIREQLLVKVDVVPDSLVKAQAAIESAWGTSRFAVEGNNYFGQWCFRAGCGLVPESREAGLDHEVRLFESPQASVNSYMLNLNSHRAYRHLRRARAELRQQQQALNGCYLARGLEQYSEKGAHYVESLKQLIRVNDLEQDSSGYCAPVMVAEEQSADQAKVKTSESADNSSPQPKEIAADDSRERITPSPDPDSPPSS